MPPRTKRKRPAVDPLRQAVLDAITCPITRALVVRPTIAEDGHTYERYAIEKWLRQRPTSPRTNQPMGANLVDSPARSMVSAAIESGAVDDKAAVGSWLVASAREMIRGSLPGGLEAAKDHLTRGVALAPAFEASLLLEAFKLRDQLAEREAADDVRADFARILECGFIVSKPAVMAEYRDDLLLGSAVVKIIDDEKTLERLCNRNAPGARYAVGFCPQMLQLCGNEYVVGQYEEGGRAYRLDREDEVSWSVPFNACILVKAS